MKIFPQKFFGQKVGLGQEELQGILQIRRSFSKTKILKRISYYRTGPGGGPDLMDFAAQREGVGDIKPSK